MSVAPRSAQQPTDQELMLFVDGELEPAREAEVAAHVASDPIGRRKVLALRFAGEVLRETQREVSAPLDLADAVMGQLDALDRSVSRVVPLDAARRRGVARRIYAVAAVAVAAAAALAVWARAGAVVESSPSMALVPPSPSLELAAPPPEPEPEAQPQQEHGAEVAAVDFGTRTGSIFYVPTEAAERNVLAVVWISDAEAARP